MIETFFTKFAAQCTSGFLGFPTWYCYLPGGKFTKLTDIWLIVLAIVEILLRVAALAAFAMVIYAGIQLITSAGNPDHAAKARGTLLNAIIGLVIAVLAATLVTFIAGSFNG